MQAHQLIADIARDQLHRETERSQGSLGSHYDYDPAGRLTRHRAAQLGSANAVTTRGRTANQAVVERAYTYDAAGQLSARADSLRGRQDFRYDATGRVLAAIPLPNSAERFAFDPAGNLLPPLGGAQGDAQSTPSTVIPDNRLRYYQDLAFEYDAHGNVTKRVRGNQSAGTHSEALLRYNADHQLTQASVSRHGVTQTTAYAYDPLGRRISKTDAFGSTAYLWDGDLMIHSQRGSKEALYLFEPNSFVPLATIQGAANNPQSQHTYWYQCDQIGAPQELTDAQGRIVWAADYKVWGEAKLRAIEWPATGTDGMPAGGRGGGGWNSGASGLSLAQSAALPPIDQPFRLQGQQFDDETGLHYNRFRYYDPVVGRFVTSDPIGLFGGMNLYTFGPNTAEYVDPLGLSAAKLGKRMQADGRGPLPGQTPHHMVQENCNENRHVQNSRAILERNDIGIDDSANGARLWGTNPSQTGQPSHPGGAGARSAGTYHAGPHVHGSANDKLIYQTLKGVEKRGGNVENALRDIGQRMENGTWKATHSCCCP